MKQSTRKAVLIGSALAAAGAIAAVVAYSSKAPAATTPPQQTPGATHTFQAGSRYRISLAGPGLPPALDPNVIQTILQTAFPGAFQVGAVGGSPQSALLYAITALQNITIPDAILNPLQNLANIVVTVFQLPNQGPFHAWRPATAINPGDHVRVSVSQAAAATLGITDQTTMTNVIRTLLGPVSSGGVNVWTPTAPMPADWPPDVMWAFEYHAEFVYAGPVAVTSIPAGVTVWVYQ
jgi:hypothetical protein